jgi:pyruvate dehydrogenase (quinone)
MPELGQARGVQIDIDGSLIGMRYPYEVNLVGDARRTLQALIPLLQHKQDRGWRGEIEKNVARWWDIVDSEAHVAAKPVNPMRIFHEFSKQAPENCIIAADSGSAANWYARNIRFRGSMRGSLSGNLATMGPGVPYAIGAKFAHPDRPAIAFEGDGAMQMNGLAELLTIARYYRDWSDPRLVVAVLHNNDLNQVTWELRAMGGSPRFVESQALPDTSYAEFAASIGLGAATVTDPEHLEDAWRDALSSDRPYLLDVHCDPDIPPIPPHATLEQMTDMAQALIKGDPSRWGVIKEGIKTKAQEFIPGSHDDD